MTPLRPTIVGEVAIVERIAGGLTRVLVGLLFIGVGLWIGYYGVQHPPMITLAGGCKAEGMNKPFLYGGGAIALFGALIMPTIIETVQHIVVVVQPFVQNIPVVGPMFGRRANDQPPRAITEPPPENKG